MSSSQKKRDEENRKRKITIDQIQNLDSRFKKYIDDKLNELQPLLDKLPERHQSRIKALPILSAELLCIKRTKVDRKPRKTENKSAIDIIFLNLDFESILSEPRTLISILKYLLDECPFYIRTLVLSSHDDDTDKFPDVKLFVETLRCYSPYRDGNHKADFWRRYAEKRRYKTKEKTLQEIAKHIPKVSSHRTAKKKRFIGRKPDATTLERLLELVGLLEKRKRGKSDLTITGIKHKVARTYNINQDTLPKWLEKHMDCLPKSKEITDLTEDDVRMMWSKVYGNTDFD